MAKLTFVLEDGQHVEVPLTGLLALGREDDNDVVIDDECISRHHAELLTHPDGRIEVHDLGSTAGTFVNDRPIRSQFIQQGDKLAFGPLPAWIEEADSPADTMATLADEKKCAQLQADIQDLARQHGEKSSALQQLAAHQAEEQARLQQIRADCDQEEQRLADVRRQLAEAEERTLTSRTLADTLEEQAQATTKQLDHLGQEQQRVQESLLRVQTELTTRENDLATEDQRVADAKARLAVQQTALEAVTSAETAGRDRLADLAGREEDIRRTMHTLAPGVESARSELADVESRLTPLRDWSKSMNQRYARLGTLAKGSAEETALLREIEAAQAALFDLLPAARIDPPALTRDDFARMSTRAGVAMKSDRIRRPA